MNDQILTDLSKMMAKMQKKLIDAGGQTDPRTVVTREDIYVRPDEFSLCLEEVDFGLNEKFEYTYSYQTIVEKDLVAAIKFFLGKRKDFKIPWHGRFVVRRKVYDRINDSEHYWRYGVLFLEESNSWVIWRLQDG